MKGWTESEPMPVSQICGRCGAELAASTSSGYCPSCLLREALVDFHGAEGAPESPEPKHPGPRSKPQSQDPEPKDRNQDARGPSPVVCGQRFGEYELLEKVGQGGMGIVYKAKQIKLDRIVALKLLPFGQFSREEAVQRFRAEATAAAALQHPNIVAIHDIGEQDGQHFFSMDFIEGQTLADPVREIPLPPRRAATYLKTIAEAVHYAHQRGILHRDLKPSNILIDQADQPRITDFGLAKRMDEATQLPLTGQVLGSPDFMAPEQAQGHEQAATPA